MPPEYHLEPSTLDLTHIVANQETIRQINPQRFEMEQLDAVVYLDTEQGLIAGYVDTHADDFWVRGHIPGNPLMPGVLMCEAAAQLCSYYTMRTGIIANTFLGFGGMENVRFRRPVRPGERLVMIGKMQRANRRQVTFNVQGFVGTTMVFHGDIIGMPLSRSMEDS